MFARENAIEILTIAQEELKTARFHIIYVSIESAKTFVDCSDIQSLLRETNKELNLGIFTFFTWSLGLTNGKYVFIFIK